MQEIYHALFYAETTKHGTVGHNQLLIIAKLAKQVGFKIVFSDNAFPLIAKDNELVDIFSLGDNIEL